MNSDEHNAQHSSSFTVLVVDDSDANRYVTSHALKRAGFKVIEAATGKEGLELAKQLPTVVILDVKLPDILGYEVCRRIKSNPLTCHIPILQMSAAFLNNESKLYALESGADAYLIQPAESVVLVATVKSLVRLHQAELQTRIASRQWQATFDSLSEGVAIIDASGIIQRCNRSLSKLLDRPYGDIENSSLPELMQSCFGLAMTSNGSVSAKEVQFGARFFRIRVDPIFSQDMPSGGIFVLEETTDQKRAEEAFLVNERLAATGRMAHTMAHEVNNPLAAITNLVYLLRNSLNDSEAARQYMDSVEQELQRISRISKQILSFNRTVPSPIRICVSELVEDVLASNRQAIAEKCLRIDGEWDSSMFVDGYPAQLRQVFSNLVHNAIEASSPGGKIRIRISRCIRWDRPGERAIRISIADYGVGIPKADMPKIFDAFFTTKARKGSGIGLWLSSTVVQEHQGRLHVRSSTQPPHSGTCISTVLPMSTSSRNAQLEPQSRLRIPTS
jgi:signal transduction histidine kinase/CheY-like chemotaxis protein